MLTMKVKFLLLALSAVPLQSCTVIHIMLSHPDNYVLTYPTRYVANEYFVVDYPIKHYRTDGQFVDSSEADTFYVDFLFGCLQPKPDWAMEVVFDFVCDEPEKSIRDCITIENAFDMEEYGVDAATDWLDLGTYCFDFSFPERSLIALPGEQKRKPFPSSDGFTSLQMYCRIYSKSEKSDVFLMKSEAGGVRMEDGSFGIATWSKFRYLYIDEEETGLSAERENSRDPATEILWNRKTEEFLFP